MKRIKKDSIGESRLGNTRYQYFLYTAEDTKTGEVLRCYPRLKSDPSGTWYSWDTVLDSVPFYGYTPARRDEIEAWLQYFEGDTDDWDIDLELRAKLRKSFGNE